MSAIETDTPSSEEPLKLPPTVNINRLSDKFKEALGRTDKVAEPSPEKPPTNSKPEPERPAPEKPQPKQEKDSKEPKIPREHFKALEAQRDDYKTKWEQAEERAKLIEAKTKELEGKIPQDYEQLKSKLSEHETLVQKFYVEHSPLFKQAYDDKIQRGIDEAKEVVGSINADQIGELLSLPPSSRRDAEIEALVADMPSFKQGALIQAMRDVRRLQKERAAELAKPTENFKQLKDVEAQRASQEKLARLEVLDRAVKITASEASKQTVHFQRIEGNEEHNQRVAENEKMLREYATADLAPDDQAKLAMWAVRGLRSNQTDAIKDALIQKLQAELKAVGDANPSVNGGGKPTDRSKPMTASEKFAKAMKEGIPQD